MVKHANRRNITTVDIHKDNYKLLKSMAEEGRYDVKALVNRVLHRVLEKEITFQEKYPNLSVFEVVGNKITLKEDTGRDKILVELSYDNNYDLECQRDKSKNCKHVSYAKNSEISIILAAKQIDEISFSKKKLPMIVV